MYAQSSLLKFINQKKQQKRQGKGMSGGAFPKWELGKLSKDKSGFLAAVFSTLIFQLCIVFAIVKFVPDDDPVMNAFKKYIFALFILEIILIFIISFVPMPMFVKFVLFTLFSGITGLTLKFALKRVSKEIIQTALFATVTIFVFFVLVGVIVSGFGIDLGFLAMFLFGFLLLAIITSVVFIFMKTSPVAKKVLTVFILVLFSVFVVFDTNQILQRDYDGDFITASIDYFLDIINIFLNLVSYMNNE